ncbi:hypothetical protein EON64_15390, partial [archaeon]
MASNLDAIRKQVEFYFSDSNYRKDTFLKAAAESDPDGFVAISVLLTFNRLKNLTTDVAEVAKAVESSDAVVLSANKDKVKRAEPLPETDESASRTLYIKGYPVDNADVTIESIAEQWSPYGKVLYVKMRTFRDRDTNARKFKGSVCVEFASTEGVDKAVAASKEDGKIILGFEDKKFVQVSTFAEWYNSKKAYLESKKGKAQKRKAEGQAEEDEDNEGDKEETREFKYENGLVVKLTDLPATHNGVELKELLRQTADVRFVDYTNGASDAFVRCGDAGAARKVAEAVNKGEVKFGEAEGKAEVLEGEGEKAYWVKNDADFKARRESRNNNKGGRGGRGGG